MPAIIPVIIMAGAAAIGGTAAIVIGTVLAVGASLLLQSKTSGVASQSSQPTVYQTNPTQLTFTADAPRRMVYGKARISGVVTYANVSGDGHEYLWLVVVVAAHQITDITAMYFNGEAASEVASGYFDWWWHDGTQTTADPQLVATFPEYTEKCILQGCAYAVVKLKFDKTVYKNGRPNITFDIKGKPLYDHRVGLTQWSNNAALATIDFMRSVDGLNATDDEIDWASVDAAADVCDQVPEQMAASLCDGRYTIDGVVELSSKNGDIINQMLAASAGTVVWTQGKYRIYVGAARAVSTRKITQDDLRGNPTLQPRTPADQSFNGVKGTFLDSTNNWQFSDFPPVKGAEYIAQDGGIEQYKDIVLNFTTSPITAQRLATIFLRRARLEKTITLPCKWTCFNYEVWDVIPLNLPMLGWVDKLFQVTDWRMIPPSGSDAGGVELVLTEYSDDLYSDDMDLKPITGGGTIVKPDVTIPKPPASLTAVSGLTAVNQQTGAPRIKFDWTQSNDIYCVGYEIAYSNYPFSPAESDYKYISGRNTTTFVTEDLKAGDTYIGYIRVVNSFEKRSEPIPSNTVIIKGSGAELPEALQGLTATNVDDMFADISWTAPTGNNADFVQLMWADKGEPTNAIELAVIPMPSTTTRVQRNLQNGYYFARFMSKAGLFGDWGFVYATGRPATGVLLQSLSLSQYDGDLVGGIWYNPTLAVSKSQRLASELGWEVFDMMVPEPFGEIDYFAKNATYVATAHTLRISGSVGWHRAPRIPNTLPRIDALAQIAYFDETEYRGGVVLLPKDANIKVGFKAPHSEPQGVVVSGFIGTIEDLT
ncbi:TPA: hypothetical protein NNT57_004551 [Salmonella enterica]|nr:hypothetical protein [Salmonella enterica]